MAQVREFCHTGATPGGPEVNQKNLALQVTGRYLALAPWDTQFKLGKGITLFSLASKPAVAACWPG